MQILLLFYLLGYPLGSSVMMLSSGMRIAWTREWRVPCPAGSQTSSSAASRELCDGSSTVSPLPSSRNMPNCAWTGRPEITAMKAPTQALSSTLLENSQAYRKYRIRPRGLRNISLVDTSCRLFGCKNPLPLGVTPMAMQCLAHPDNELVTARACRHAGVITSLSPFVTTTREDIETASGPNSQVVQPYLLEDREQSQNFINDPKPRHTKPSFWLSTYPCSAGGSSRYAINSSCPSHTSANFTEYCDLAVSKMIIDGISSTRIQRNGRARKVPVHRAIGMEQGEGLQPDRSRSTRMPLTQPCAGSGILTGCGKSAN